VERSLPRFVAARLVSGRHNHASAQLGPLHLVDTEPPELPGPGWRRVRPHLAGICGSDLATLSGVSSRWFEPVVSFPFVPGHEVVGSDDTGRRVVLQPVLGCVPRGIEQRCAACSAGSSNRCTHLSAGHLQPGLQTGFCADTGGGWSEELVAHDSQLHEVPPGWSDQAAVLVEPVACALHGALSAPPGDGLLAVVIGAGTMGLGAIAALARLRPDVERVLAVAKHPHQRRLALDLGASSVAEPAELRRAVRRLSGSWMLDNGQLTGGAPIVVDCVGSADSLADALAVTAPGGTLVLLGMAGTVGVDLTGLWQREVRLQGSYAYGPEPLAGGRHSFALAFDLVEAAGLDRLVSATYPLGRYAEAVAHAADAGRRGAVKVVFDPRRRPGVPRPEGTR
jgi:threonine dehydrogenase-like Zn-dependent dehydrogenase